MQEEIFLQNRKKDKLAAILHTPKKSTNKIIIITHSFKGDKDYQPIIKNFSVRAEKEGYSVIRFDCWGSGESDGKFEESSITTQIRDLEDVIKSVKLKGYSNLCLVGLSLGTTNSIMAYDESINCMVLWSPVFQHEHLYEDYKDEMLEKGFIVRKRNLTGEEVKVGKGMWRDFKKIKPYERLPSIKCPVLAIIGSEDPHISEAKAKKFMDLIPSKHELKIINGGDHDFLVKEAERKAIDLSLNWLKNYF